MHKMPSIPFLCIQFYPDYQERKSSNLMKDRGRDLFRNHKLEWVWNRRLPVLKSKTFSARLQCRTQLYNISQLALFATDTGVCPLHPGCVATPR